uniref:Methyltransferase n=1 Tax=Echinococcus granulosus TaxID=6210 RepID=U6FQS5_ECHGR|nr:hypothetical protein EgrG_002068900 [Echinococcus granulosus]
MIRARRSLDRRVLLDFGCSKGILSILDAKAGAAYVYTPDGVASLCQLPRQIIAENLFSCTTGKPCFHFYFRGQSKGMHV